MNMIAAQHNTRIRSGFTLVELSIVLVILGLLVGGVLSGQSLIRASELRAVTTEYSRWVTATQSFRDKYFALPGDMSNATSFWNADANCAGTYTGTTAAAGTCNGDGNGTILNYAAAASKTAETFQFWKQLALAGMIEGSYTGFAGSGSNIESIIGQNVPRSKLSNAGWSSGAWDNSSGTADAYNFAINYLNSFSFGKQVATQDTSGAAIKPEEAWNIDTKMDDGKPGYGKLLGMGGAWGTNACTTAANATDYNASYNLTNSGAVCIFRSKNNF
jgi:prepilin-type N-terminal cleavage/methylation domain-containing protein